MGHVYPNIVSSVNSITYIDYYVDRKPANTLFQYKILSVSGDESRKSEDFSNVATYLGDGPINKRVGSGDNAAQPTTFKVVSYPNPLNPITTIRYSLPKQSKVLIWIYTVPGQPIATIKSYSNDLP